MGREYELKYAATAAIHAALAAQFEGFVQIRMETTYYDTPEHLLSGRKMTLRLRQENQRSVCTLKTPLADGSLGEWECDAGSIREGMAQLLEMGAPDILRDLAVFPVCGARFTRMAALIPTADGTAELALDSGVLLGGGRELPLCEVELELKTGSEQATADLAAALAAQWGMTPEPASKFKRASRLAKGE